MSGRRSCIDNQDCPDGKECCPTKEDYKVTECMSKKECKIERSLNPVAEVPFEIEDSINVLDRCWTTVYEEVEELDREGELDEGCLLYTSPSPRDRQKSRMPSSA